MELGVWGGRAIRRPKGHFCCGDEAGLGLASTGIPTPSGVAAIDEWAALVREVSQERAASIFDSWPAMNGGIVVYFTYLF